MERLLIAARRSPARVLRGGPDPDATCGRLARPDRARLRRRCTCLGGALEVGEHSRQLVGVRTERLRPCSATRASSTRSSNCSRSWRSKRSRTISARSAARSPLTCRITLPPQRADIVVEVHELLLTWWSTLHVLSRPEWLAASELRIGLGCMRMSTDEPGRGARSRDDRGRRRRRDDRVRHRTGVRPGNGRARPQRAATGRGLRRSRADRSVRIVTEA